MFPGLVMRRHKQAICLVLVTLMLFVSSAPSKTYYEILEVEQEASLRQIKKAYYQLALKYHPDKSSSLSKQERHDKFAAVSNAYEVLSDADKREIYDDLLKHGIYSFNYHNLEKEELRKQHEEKMKYFKMRDPMDTYNQAMETKKFDDLLENGALVLGGCGILFGIYYLVMNTSLVKGILKTKEKEKQEKELAENVVKRVAKNEEKEKRLQELNQKRRQEMLETIAKRKAIREEMEALQREEKEEPEVKDVVDALKKEKKDKEDSKSHVFYCRPCKKGFKSEAQMENHEKSKKHLQIVGVSEPVKKGEKQEKKKKPQKKKAKDMDYGYEEFLAEP